MSRLRTHLIASLAATMAWACTDGPGPTDGAGRPVPFEIVPSFQLDPSLFSYDPIDRMRIVATDVSTSGIVGSSNVTVDPAAAQWFLDLGIDVGDAAEIEVIVEIELLSGQSAEWSGRAGPILVRRGEPIQAHAIEVYRGPLDNLDVVSLAIQGAPAGFVPGATTTLSADLALLSGSTATPVVFWASSNPAVATVTSEGASVTLTAVSPGTTDIIAAAGSAFEEFSLQILAGPPPGLDLVWSGTTTDWGDPNNWTPAVVPTASHNVIIPFASNAPVLSSDQAIGGLTIEVGALLDQGGFTLSVAGDVAVAGGVGNGWIDLTGSASVLYGGLDNLRISAARTLSGNLTLAGDLDVSHQLSIGPFTAFVSGDLVVQTTTGQVLMRDLASQLDVSGNATFDGASSAGVLEAGYLFLQGDFTATSTNSPDSFQSSGTIVFLRGSADQTVTLDNPGPLGQSFSDLYVDQGGGGAASVFATDALVTGLLQAVTATLRQGGASTLQVQGTLYLDLVTLDGLPLELVSGSAPNLHILRDVTFTNMATDAVQFYAELPGAGASVPLTLSSPIFDPTPPTPGYYVQGLNSLGAGGLALEIQLVGATPAGATRYLEGANTVIAWP